MRLAGEKNRSTDSIPPTSNALLQHILRASLQAQVWNECLQPLQIVREPEDWGWAKSPTGLAPVWTTPHEVMCILSKLRV